LLGTLGDERRVCILITAAVLATVRAILHALNDRMAFGLNSNTETWSCTVNRDINYKYTSTAVISFMSSSPAHNIHSTTHNDENNGYMKTKVLDKSKYV
jgi:hypothetical protein